MKQTWPFWLVVVLVVSFSVWMTYKNPPRAIVPSKTESEGVVLHGHLTTNGGSGWIENTNNFPVRIRQVRWTGHGDETEWMEFFEPMRERSIAYIDDQMQFYIYTKEGGLIGFIPCSSLREK